MASTNPRATARPSPTPAWFERSPRRWNGAKTPSRSLGPDAGPPVDHPEVDAPADLARLDPHPAAGGRPRHGVGHDVGQGPLEQRRVGLHRGTVSATATSTRRAARSRGWPGRRPPPPRGTPAATTSTAPACSRLMSRRLPTSAVEPVDLLVDGGQELLALGLRRPVDVGLEQAGDRRLDRRQRRAQVVGDGPQQGGAQGVGLGQGRRIGRLGLEAPALEGRASGPKGAGPAGRRPTAGDRARPARRRRSRRDPRWCRRRAWWATGARCRPPASTCRRAGQQGDGVEQERRPDLVEHGGDAVAGLVVGEGGRGAGEGLGLGPGPQGLAWSGRRSGPPGRSR